jgi:hypothetical protein
LGVRRDEGTATLTDADIIVATMCAQYRTAVAPPQALAPVNWQDSEQSARALLAVNLAPNPVYLGANAYLPVVDALCGVAGVRRLRELTKDEERFRTALVSAFVGLDLTREQALKEVMRILHFLRHVSGDVAGFLAACHESERARMTLSLVAAGDQRRLQWLYDQLGIDERALPTGGAAAVAVRLGLNSVADSVWGMEALRENVRLMLCQHPSEVYFALEFYSDVVCDSWLGCTECACGGRVGKQHGDGGTDVLCTALIQGWV